MNLRQKKKLFKKKTGYNPQKYAEQVFGCDASSRMKYSGCIYHNCIKKKWGGLAELERKQESETRELKRQQEIKNLENMNRILGRRKSWIELFRRYSR